MTATIHAHPAALQAPHRLFPTLHGLEQAFGLPIWIDPADPKNTVTPLSDTNIATLNRELGK